MDYRGAHAFSGLVLHSSVPVIVPAAAKKPSTEATIELAYQPINGGDGGGNHHDTAMGGRSTLEMRGAPHKGAPAELGFVDWIKGVKLGCESGLAGP